MILTATLSSPGGKTAPRRERISTSTGPSRATVLLVHDQLGELKIFIGVLTRSATANPNGFRIPRFYLKPDPEKQTSRRTEAALPRFTPRASALQNESGGTRRGGDSGRTAGIPDGRGMGAAACWRWSRNRRRTGTHRLGADEILEFLRVVAHV